jgi:hypothetical protein
MDASDETPTMNKDAETITANESRAMSPTELVGTDQEIQDTPPSLSKASEDHRSSMQVCQQSRVSVLILFVEPRVNDVVNINVFCLFQRYLTAG